jgi:hypothetical protein
VLCVVFGFVLSLIIFFPEPDLWFSKGSFEPALSLICGF